MVSRNVTKQLAGIEDLLIGNGSVAQTRSGAEYQMTAFRPQHTVDTVADLQDVVYSKIAAVSCIGGVAIDDGLGSNFYWNAASTATHNGTTIVQIAGVVTGRWLAYGSTIAMLLEDADAAYSVNSTDLMPLVNAAGTIKKGVTPQQIISAAGTIVVADKAAAKLIAPTAGASLIILSDDGAGYVFEALTGVAPGTYTDDSTIACGTIFRHTGGDGSTAWKRKYSGAVNATWFGAVGDGVTDDIIALQEAVDSVGLSAYGGDVELPAGRYYITSTLNIGNGTAGGVYSTHKIVRLIGLGGLAGFGANNPTGGASIKSNVAGPAIKICGPLLGWAVLDIFVSFTTTSTSAISIEIWEAKYGECRMSITGCPGTSVYMDTYNFQNNYNNFFDFYIYLSPSHQYAKAMVLTGQALGSADTAGNIFRRVRISLTHEDQTGIVFQYCDNNIFQSISLLAVSPNGCNKGIVFDHTMTTASGTGDFPGGNTILHLEASNNKIIRLGTPDVYPTAVYPNRVIALSTGGATQIPIFDGLAISKTPLTANQTFYVSTTGSDITGLGYLSTGRYWATVSHAISIINSRYDLMGFTVTIQLADGTYTSSTAISKPINNGKIIIQGNVSDPTAVVVSTTSSNAFSANGMDYTLKDLIIETTTSGYGVKAFHGGKITLDTVYFGSCASGHMNAYRGGIIYVNGNYTISGITSYHWTATDGGQIQAPSIVVTYSGTPVFSIFAYADRLSYINARSTTYVGSGATGKKYTANMNSVISSNGASLPGDVAGTTATGGQYN